MCDHLLPHPLFPLTFPFSAAFMPSITMAIDLQSTVTHFLLHFLVPFPLLGMHREARNHYEVCASQICFLPIFPIALSMHNNSGVEPRIFPGPVSRNSIPGDILAILLFLSSLLDPLNLSHDNFFLGGWFACCSEPICILRCLCH